MNVSTVARPADGSAPAGRARRSDVVAVVLAASPFWLTAVGYAVTGHLVLGGDQALLGLDALDARHLEQSVGPYSRMGWAHPGPVWLYLLGLGYFLFGSTGQALVVASLILHGVFAALAVVAAGGERRWQRPLMAALLLLYVLRMPSVDFVSVWNPFALLLPTVVLFLVAARACAGSLPALAGSAVLASFLLQTHVGTVPLVGAVGLTVVLAVGVRLVRRSLPRPTGRDWQLVTAAAVVIVLMWWLPAWQQLRAEPGEGNLGRLLRYFLHGAPDASATTHSWAEAFSSLGQLVGAPVYGWMATPGIIDASRFSSAVVLAVLAVTVGALALARAARRVGDQQSAWLGLLTAVGAAAGLVAGRVVTGDLQNYLLLWVTTLPVVLVFALASWLSQRLVDQSRIESSRLVGGLLTGSVVLAVLVTGALYRSASALPSQPGADEAAALVVDALPPASSVATPVYLDIADVSVWTTATEVALRLEQSGYRVAVDQEWVYSFGEDREVTGVEQWHVTMAPAAGAPAVQGELIGTVTAINGPVVLALGRPG